MRSSRTSPYWGPWCPSGRAAPLLPTSRLHGGGGEAILRLLSDLVGRTTATLVVEDLQWADPETADVVEFLADNVPGSGMLLVATARDGEAGAGSALATDLVRRRVAEELTLGPLAPTDVLLLASACAPDGEVPGEIEQALLDRSDGVPFLVEELVATARTVGWDSVGAAVPGSVERSGRATCKAGA